MGWRAREMFDQGARTETPHTSGLVKLAINLLLMLVLFGVLELLILVNPAKLGGFADFLNCRHLEISALGSLLVLAILHIVVRVFGLAAVTALGGSPLELLLKLVGRAHPWPWSDRSYFCVAVPVVLLLFMLPVVALVFGWLPPLGSREDAPAIRGFSVRDEGGTTREYKPGEGLDLMAGEQVEVQVILGNQAVSSCKWFTAKGILRSAGSCATLYEAPSEPTYDVLTVQVQSRCRTCTAFEGLGVQISGP